MNTELALKRVYDPISKGDGMRILVDRLWPRGLSKERAQIDLWLKEVAPSTELRQWFGHDPAKWEEFTCRYRRELEQNPEAVQRLGEAVKGRRATLLYAAKDAAHAHAKVLQQYLEGCLGEGLV